MVTTSNIAQAASADVPTILTIAIVVALVAGALIWHYLPSGQDRNTTSEGGDPKAESAGTRPAQERLTRPPIAANAVRRQTDQANIEPAATEANEPSSNNIFGIFISYRRQDEPNFTGRLYDRLETRFNKRNVFMDVDSIELGLDFAEVIGHSLAQCTAMLVVIGKGWLDARDSKGRRRIDSSNDYVRIEIESALRRHIRVIPILVEGASIPDSDELPNSLESLSRRNGIEMSHARFSSDAERLIDTLERVTGLKPGF